MGKRQPRIVVTFHTTTEAIAMRQSAAQAGLRGRLVPIPRQLSAGCGLAWSEPADNEDELMRHIARFELAYEQVTPLEL